MTYKRHSNKTPKDHQRTPPELFQKLDDRFHFDVDVAASKENALCPGYYTEEDNALKQEWYQPAADPDESVTRFFCNPPYSHNMVEQFLRKGYRESLQGALVVFLITSDVSPIYYDICANAAEWIAIKGRVRFCEGDGTPCDGCPPFGSMAIVFDAAQRKAQGGKTIVTRLDWKKP